MTLLRNLVEWLRDLAAGPRITVTERPPMLGGDAFLGPGRLPMSTTWTPMPSVATAAGKIAGLPLFEPASAGVSACEGIRPGRHDVGFATHLRTVGELEHAGYALAEATARVAELEQLLRRWMEQRATWSGVEQGLVEETHGALEAGQ